MSSCTHIRIQISLQGKITWKPYDRKTSGITFMKKYITDENNNII